MSSLVRKYNIPGPRYTSYPTVPFWNVDAFSGKEYKAGLRRGFEESNGIDCTLAAVPPLFSPRKT